jgi:hypothetical protein
MESASVGPKASASEQLSSSEEHAANHSVQSAAQQRSTAGVRKCRGPRTRLGKARSRCNAVKHGLCAKEVFLEGESPAEFEAFWQGFRNYFRPVGIPEEDLVQERALLKWRSHRVLAAERAEIELERQYNSRAADREKHDLEEAVAIEASVDAQTARDRQTFVDTRAAVEIPMPGLFASLNNPVILEKFLSLLKSLRKSIKMRSFSPDRDHQILNKLFGERTPSEFRFFYSLCAEPEPLIKHEQFKKFDLPLDKRRSMFLTHLEETINCYEELARQMDADSAKREKLESKSAAVPEASRLDRLLRSRTSLDRQSERNLNELLLLQRIRKGQPVAPTLN